MRLEKNSSIKLISEMHENHGHLIETLFKNSVKLVNNGYSNYY